MFINILLNNTCTVYTKVQTWNVRDYDTTPTHTDVPCMLKPNSEVIESGFANDPALATYVLYTREDIARTEDKIVVDGKNYIVQDEPIRRNGTYWAHTKYLLAREYDRDIH